MSYSDGWPEGSYSTPLGKYRHRGYLGIVAQEQERAVMRVLFDFIIFVLYIYFIIVWQLSRLVHNINSNEHIKGYFKKH